VKSEQSALFQSKAVKLVLAFKWANYGFMMHLQKFGMYLMLLCFMWVYAAASYYPNALKFLNTTGQFADGFDVLRMMIGFCAAVLVCRYMFIELQELFRSGMGYLGDTWNVLDVSTFVLLAVVLATKEVLIPRLETDGEGWARFFAEDSNHEVLAFLEDFLRSSMAISNFLLWCHMVSYLRGFQATGTLMHITLMICWEMKSFLIILIIFTLAFTQVFSTLNVRQKTDDDVSYTENLWATIRTNWLGNEPANYFDQTRNATSETHTDNTNGMEVQGIASTETFLVIERLMYFICSFVVTIVMLNLLIAIMGETFNRIKAQSDVAHNQQMASLIHTLDQEMYVSPLDEEQQETSVKFPKYLIFADEEDKAMVQGP